MSSGAPVVQPAAESWHASSQIRMALSVIVVPLLIRLAQHTPLGQWLAAYLGINLLTMKAADIVDWLMLAISVIGGVFWIHKRVKAGKNPNSDAPEIIPPKLVQRLTGNVRVVSTDEYAQLLKNHQKTVDTKAAASEPIETKNVPFVDPETAREEIDDLATIIKRDEEFRHRLERGAKDTKA